MSALVVIELFDGMPDDAAHDRQRLRMVQQMAALGGALGDGVLDLSDGTNTIGARVVGVVTAEDSPGDQRIMAVEPLEVP
jgi:hypothetical protein